MLKQFLELANMTAQKKKILIVDDEPNMRIFLSNLLHSDGFDSIDAIDSDEGLRKALEYSPDVIILDAMLPSEAGLRIYHSLKCDARLKQIPVLMLATLNKKTFTHYRLSQNIQRGCVLPEPEAYLEKPPEAEELLNIVRRLSHSASVKPATSTEARGR